MPHTEQRSLTLRFQIGFGSPFTSIHISDSAQSPGSGLPTSCQYVLCLSDHILHLCHLPGCPLPPTESAIHNQSSSTHCTLLKLLRSSCHLTHGATQTMRPVLLRLQISALPALTAAGPLLLQSAPMSSAETLLYLGSQRSEHSRQSDVLRHTWFTEMPTVQVPSKHSFTLS